MSPKQNLRRQEAWGACPSSGDVLFSKDGTVGKVHVVSKERRFAVLSSIAILRPDRPKRDPAYRGYALRSPIVLRDATNRKPDQHFNALSLKT
jgi:type I restriction enzyme, S subunit